MFDIDEIMKRAQMAKERTSESLKELKEESEQLAERLTAEEEAECGAADREAEQLAANTQRQVEILGQVLGAGDVAQIP